MADASPRIVLGLEADGSRAAIEAATLLAQRLGADLNALFVEDQELLRLARLPFTSLTPACGSRTLGGESKDVMAALRAERPALLIVPKGGSPLDGPGLRALREQASCPLVLVR